MDTFATLVRRARAATGMSYQRISDLVGRAPSTIRGWEKGRSEPSDPETVMTLAAVLNIPEDTLLESVGMSRPENVVAASFADLEQLGEPAPFEEAPSEPREPVVAAAEPAGTDLNVATHEEEPSSPVAVGGRHEVERRSSRAIPIDTRRPVIPPQPASVVERSYLEDQHELMTYRVRAVVTVVICIVLLLLIEWGLHGAGSSLKNALSGLTTP
jgi:transcriptional regulator with XRE-family HTH domain